VAVLKTINYDPNLSIVLKNKNTKENIEMNILRCITMYKKHRAV
tara:strand:- start:206 stop:337 length:132 start_codon:yes stop_codon:yes gene_type:complete